MCHILLSFIDINQISCCLTVAVTQQTKVIIASHMLYLLCYLISAPLERFNCNVQSMHNPRDRPFKALFA
ncbi:hypothetical protein XENTR_v10016566 [Xenopus tropicalis]|nr:hypothetical protein XENTR_v10016566 [Xenopus tropicalis]